MLLVKYEAYQYGGHDRSPENILRLVSELEGAYQLLHFMSFDEDRDILMDLKTRYNKLYFKVCKEQGVKPF